MKRAARALVGVAFAIFALAGVTRTAAADDAPSFDGTWEGIIHFDKEAFLVESSTPAAGLPFRLDIHGAVVRVFIREDHGFVEAKPGAFHIAPVSANAVIFATDAAPDDSWVESWTFTVTRKGDSLFVEYSRLVNNTGAPEGEKGSHFATRGEGEFKIVQP